MSAAIVSQTRYSTCAPLEQVTGIDPMKDDGNVEPPPPKRQKQPSMSHFFNAKPQPTEAEKQQENSAF